MSRRVEFVLASPTVNGELEKAVAVAYADYRRFKGLAEDAEPWGDWLRVEARDDEIVISYVVERDR